MPPHDNKGLRKLCDCARKRWSECEHAWYLNFQWKGPADRFNLDRELNRHIASKTEAAKEAEHLRIAIRAGTFRAAAPALASLTLAQLFAEYDRRYLQIHCKARETGTKSQITVITRTILPHPTLGDVPFGRWLVKDITTDTIEQYREIRRGLSPIAANRNLALLRAMFNWGASKKRGHLVPDNPFRDGDQAAIRGISAKTERSRRLEDGEADRLLAAWGSHLRALVEAALETGCRKGSCSPSSGIRSGRTTCSYRRRRPSRAKPGRSPSRTGSGRSLRCGELVPTATRSPLEP